MIGDIITGFIIIILFGGFWLILNKLREVRELAEDNVENIKKLLNELEKKK